MVSRVYLVLMALGMVMGINLVVNGGSAWTQFLGSVVLALDIYAASLIFIGEIRLSR